MLGGIGALIVLSRQKFGGHHEVARRANIRHVVNRRFGENGGFCGFKIGGGKTFRVVAMIQRDIFEAVAQNFGKRFRKTRFFFAEIFFFADVKSFDVCQRKHSSPKMHFYMCILPYRARACHRKAAEPESFFFFRRRLRSEPWEDREEG